ncbi:inner nuclear membrane protein enriched at telomere/subtelomere region, partial [Coemansia sp. 'formosensis']
MSDQYLEAGFDPQGLKMSAIRNILNKHSVDFPSNAKKSELLGILQRGVLDQASKLRKEAKKQKRVKADGRDIEVVPPGVSAIGERTRARTPKAAERTRPALVKRDTKDEAVKAAPAAAEAIAKAPAAAPIAKAPAAVPIVRAPVTPIAKAKTISKAPVTPVTKAASVSKGPPTPLSRPLLPTIAKGPSTPIGKAPSTPIAKAAVAPAAAVRAPTAAAKVSSKTTTKVSSGTDAVDKTKRKSKKIKREQLAAATAAESPPPKSTMDKAVAVKAGAKRKLSDAEATEGGKGAAVDSGDEEFYTPAKARINEAQRQRMAAQRGAAAADEKPRKHVTAHATKERAKAAAGNFSDENPFQSSPETARKRRRKATDATQAIAAEGGPVTPLAALRKSQVSDLSFKVALPRTAPAAAPAPEAVEEGEGMDLDLDQHEDLAEAEQLLPQSHVGDLVAQFQQQQQEQAEVAELPARDLSGPPKFSLAPPLASAPSARFTMTPDALRQLASSSSHPAPPPAQPPHHRRATTNQIHRLPPVAPRIAVAPRNPTAPRIARAGAGDSDGDSDGDLQRRRVATLRQHVEGAREGRHSRRSSVASTISEARGATGIPSRAMAHGSGGSSAQFKRRRRGGGGTLRAVASWVGVAAAALAAWRTHEQWALGFGNARAELAFQAPPAGSVLAVADAPPAAGSAVGDQIRYWAQYARAAVVAEPLSCPEHAECAPFVPLHAWRAA